VSEYLDKIRQSLREDKKIERPKEKEKEGPSSLDTQGK
jgi:hypothetical protein